MTNLWLRLQRVRLILVQKRLDSVLVARARLQVGKKGPLELWRRESLAPALRVPVDAPPDQADVLSVRPPQATADEGSTRLAVDVVERVGAFLPRSVPGG